MNENFGLCNELCFQAAPSLITHVQRTEAEAVFMNFRRTKCPYQICRYIFGELLVVYFLNVTPKKFGLLRISTNPSHLTDFRE